MSDAKSPRTKWPPTAVNEYEIIIVGIAIGGEYAHQAAHRAVCGPFREHFYWPSDPAHVNAALGVCLGLEKMPALQQVAETIVLAHAADLAAGAPIDDRMRHLVLEWCERRINSKKSGRKRSSPLKELAAKMGLVEMAGDRERAYGIKKQMLAALQDRLSLKRSQLSELTGNFDPWKHIEKDKPVR
jgi:hypothetical protein